MKEKQEKTEEDYGVYRLRTDQIHLKSFLLIKSQLLITSPKHGENLIIRFLLFLTSYSSGILIKK